MTGGQAQLAHLAVSVPQIDPFSSLHFSSLSIRLGSIFIILDSRLDWDIESGRICYPQSASWLLLPRPRLVALETTD